MNFNLKFYTLYMITIVKLLIVNGEFKQSFENCRYISTRL